MKTLYTLFIGLFISVGVMAQSCLPEGITFLTQSQIDSFQINYPNCTRIEGILRIGVHSPLLSNVSNLNGLSALTYVGALSIEHNDTLNSLSGLDGIDTIGGYFTIANNWNLTSLTELESLKHIGGSLSIGYRILNPLGGGWVAVGTNLETLTGLDKIHTIGGGVGIMGNNSLSSISELNNVKSIDGGIYIWRNDSLSSLIGLDNIDASSIDTISIFENASLTECEINSICDYILSPNTIPYIADNALGCSSIQEVEEACESASIGEIVHSNSLIIYPNPSSTQITIELPTTPQKNTFLTIYNLNGQQLISQGITEPQMIVDVSGLPSGIYYIKVMDSERVMIGKVVKE